MRPPLLLAIAVITCGTSSAQLCRQDLAPNSPPANPSHFGRALHAFGERVIVGASSGGVTGPFGAPFYRRDPATSRLVLETVLTPNDPHLAGGFGADVHIAGDLAVIGARTASTSSVTQCGAAYVFRRVGGSWVQEAKLVANDATAGDGLGFCARISGDDVVASAPYRRYSLPGQPPSP